MHIHYFQHDHFEDMGYIGLWAGSHNFSTSVTRFDLKPEFPSHNQYDWLVIMGGKMSVNDTDEYPWLSVEIRFIKKAIESGKTVIGICLGSQLIARALGSKVYKNHEPEMGFWPVKLLPEAAKDPVFKHFPSELTVLHMHVDVFELPVNATPMANSSVTPCQAYRYGQNVFAFQFHFEVTPENVLNFIQQVEPEIVEGQYSQSVKEMTEFAACCYSNNQIFNSILDSIYLRLIPGK